MGVGYEKIFVVIPAYVLWPIYLDPTPELKYPDEPKA